MTEHCILLRLECDQREAKVLFNDVRMSCHFTDEPNVTMFQ